METGNCTFTGVLVNRIGLMVTGVLGTLVVSLSLMVCFFASSLTYLIIPIGVFSGYIRDVTGSYTAIFYTSAGTNLFAAVLFLVAHITRKREREEFNKRTSVFFLTGF
ncbi:uncharacterized protein LOC123542459 [Mercenaria mercenaria]|uniref:uncharacterized protein LOC123542459 n=1 Tax=Mercenaria mercenaria TaxID=6596 RepID=UPI00234E784A|nr:uncharacterized protein LOC123542459 [Mercenaria mercenaria]